MSLFNISAEFAELFDRFDELSEEDDPTLLEAWFDTLEGIEGAFNQKAVNVALYIKSLSAEADAIKAEMKSLQSRAKAKENKAKRLKEYLLECMERIQLTKIDEPAARISVRNNPESVRIADEASFIAWAKGNAAELLRYAEPDIDKTAIKKALSSGEIEIPGAALERTKSVIIK